MTTHKFRLDFVDNESPHGRDRGFGLWYKRYRSGTIFDRTPVGRGRQHTLVIEVLFLVWHYSFNFKWLER